MLNFETLQAEVAEWAAKNFPASTANEPFMGIVEEQGEMASARHSLMIALRDRDIKGQDEAEKDIEDAIADMAIFAIDYCNKRGFWLTRILADIGLPDVEFDDFQGDVVMSRESVNPLLVLTIHVGHLAHHRLKAQQGIRGDAATHEAGERIAIAEIFVSLAQICDHFEFELWEVLEQTWAQVKRRDWTTKGVEPGLVPDRATDSRTATTPDEPDVYTAIGGRSLDNL